MQKKVIFVFFLFLSSKVFAGFFENEQRVSVKDCQKYYEKSKIINKYVNKYKLSETLERSDEYYEFAHLGNYYNLFFGYKIYDKNFKYIVNSECITIDFDKENKKEKDEFD